MNLDETVQLVAMVAANDRRTTGDTDIEIWHEALADLPYGDCRAVVMTHIREGEGWLMPAQVRRGVKAIRAARVAAAPDLPPDADPDDVVAYRHALLEQRRRQADGQPAEPTRVLVAKPAGWVESVRRALDARPVATDEPTTFRQAMDQLAARTRPALEDA